VSERETARLFFALRPEARAVQQLEDLQQSLRTTITGRWIPLSNLHVTLVFLGQVPLARLAELNTIAAGLSVSPFSLSLNRLECWRGSRVLCLTPGKAPAGLNELVEGLSEELVKSGFRLEKRPFRAHLTMAREVTVNQPATMLSAPILLEPDSFSLLESRAGPCGSAYPALGTWPFVLQNDERPGVSPKGAMR